MWNLITVLCIQLMQLCWYYVWKSRLDSSKVFIHNELCKWPDAFIHVQVCTTISAYKICFKEITGYALFCMHMAHAIVVTTTKATRVQFSLPDSGTCSWTYTLYNAINLHHLFWQSFATPRPWESANSLARSRLYLVTLDSSGSSIGKHIYISCSDCWS